MTTNQTNFLPIKNSISLIFLLSILFYSINILTIEGQAPIEQKYKTITLVNGVKVKLPSDFTLMSDDDLALKYPSTKKPLAMYTSADKLADFGLNVSKTVWSENDLIILKKIYKSTILEMYVKVNFIKEEIITIDGKKFIQFEFTSEVENHKKYTHVLYTLVKQHVYIFNFTCPQRVQDKWQPAIPQIINSIQFNLAAPTTSEYQKKEGVKYYQPKRKIVQPSK
ncbi:MAG: hypothetical protein EAZ07_02250 [Cytophagales bacterium]|nr:MAG: hypothetical protein EAZ07_02250 [Cytophagales bacterium]